MLLKIIVILSKKFNLISFFLANTLMQSYTDTEYLVRYLKSCIPCKYFQNKLLLNVKFNLNFINFHHALIILFNKLFYC